MQYQSPTLRCTGSCTLALPWINRVMLPADWLLWETKLFSGRRQRFSAFTVSQRLQATQGCSKILTPEGKGSSTAEPLEGGDFPDPLSAVRQNRAYCVNCSLFHGVRIGSAALSPADAPLTHPTHPDRPKCPPCLPCEVTPDGKLQSGLSVKPQYTSSSSPQLLQGRFRTRCGKHGAASIRVPEAGG